MAGRTLFTVLEETAARYGDAAALHQPSAGKTNRRYRTYSWNDWARASREIARGLLALGLRKGEVAAILSETRAEFYLVDLGIMGAGGVAAALYTAYPPAELARNLVQAQPRFLFIEDTKTLASLKSAVAAQGGTMPQHVIVMTGETGGAMSLDDLRT
ncbi:MAG: AMP-binding protein, partial [Acidobacteriaceae bacterium]|nr:AMP-binding protein [Acidobacteriaceae bacterium]